MKNSEIAKAFIDAIPFLNVETYSDLGNDYICNAIIEASRGGFNPFSPTAENAKVAESIIEGRLTYKNSFNEGLRTYTFRSWLSQYVGIPDEELTYKAVQAHRLAWLKLLIEEFSNDREYVV